MLTLEKNSITTLQLIITAYFLTFKYENNSNTILI